MGVGGGVGRGLFPRTATESGLVLLWGGRDEGDLNDFSIDQGVLCM